MKNIAFMVYDLSCAGGTQRVTATLAKELRKYYNIYVITLYGYNNFFEIDKNIRIYNLNNKFVRLRYSLVENLFDLRKYIKNNNVEVLIVIGRNNTFLPLLLKFFCNIKIIFCEHASRLEYTFFKETFKEKLYRKIFEYLIDICSDKIVFLTNRELNLYLQNRKKNLNKLQQIYNFIDDDLFDNVNNYNINSKKIITVGRIEYAKGIDKLIDVAKIVFQIHPDWQWHIYGDGNKEYIDKIKEIINKNNLENNIVLKGKEKSIYKLYQQYSFFVFTSLSESFGMVLIEAKVKKLLIISFDINSGPSDIIRNNIDGFLIKPFSIKSMAEAICNLIENPDLRKSFSNNAYGNISKFTKDNLLKKWCDLIENL